jgi:LmbE family N-acetylglucosaminyl deacetylase
MNKFPKVFSILLLSAFSVMLSASRAQVPVTNSSTDIYMQLRKLNVLGSVLYIAAHPDDENNGFLPYLAKEKLYRTGYLSLTRGDGGQNLIGSEQGIELGLIRTQELLAARRIDGAEQYFSRAYEFGFSKSWQEALRIWDREKVLSDVVWMIRKFQPDIIITRFPGDARAGHGHHAASSVLAQEAYTAAADPKRFSEQFKYGVQPWQAKRILWNTFNFGGTNTTSNDQLKIEVGGYNALIGKSYGELGGEARTLHKSQGEGRPRRRGQVYEFFSTLAGDTPKNDLMDGIVTDWKRINGGEKIQSQINHIISNYQFEKPEASVPALVNLYRSVKALPAGNWRDKKLAETQDLIEACSALFSEATTAQENVVQGNVLNVNFFFNKRKEANVVVKNIKLENFDTTVNESLGVNNNFTFNRTIPVAADKKISQPYWLEYPKEEGIFDVRDQTLIGKAENDPSFEAVFSVTIEGEDFIIKRPVQYKVVDPAKGELYEPLAVLPRVELNFTKENFISLNGQTVEVQSQFKKNAAVDAPLETKFGKVPGWDTDTRSQTAARRSGFFMLMPKDKQANTKTEISVTSGTPGVYLGTTKVIAYDHIPTITYFTQAKANLLNLNIKTEGKKIGYIVGAGDKVPQALEQLGYEVKILSEADITEDNLKQFDAVITGIRAGNIFEFLTAKNDVLNKYVENGGNLIAQYIKSNTVGAKRLKLGPYPFSISTGSRVTEEDAKVKFVLPEHAVLNYPNKITEKDFDGWIQERSTYQVDQADAHYEMPLAMSDTGEKESKGSLAIAKYGKGNFAYVSLVLFRELPAGVPGAYRILANLVALPKNK